MDMATGQPSPAELTGGDIHVLPLNDLLLHTDSGTACMCDPKIEAIGGRLLIIHNSYDGREEKEDE